MIRDQLRMGKRHLHLSELPEIIGISDRIIVMKDGRITGEFTREEASEELSRICNFGEGTRNRKPRQTARFSTLRERLVHWQRWS